MVDYGLASAGPFRIQRYDMARLTSVRPTIGALAPRLRPAPKIADPFYLSREWRVFARDMTRQRGNRCEDCGATGVRLIADHAHERKDGGADFDPANIIIRCYPCHNRKTHKAKRQRAMGQRGS